VTDLDHRRALLIARIDAHRAMLGLEARCARASMGSMSGLLGALGLDGSVAGAVVSGVRLASGSDPDSLHAWSAAVPLLVGAVLRVLSARHDEKPEEHEP
jgi:hypothetical protein